MKKITLFLALMLTGIFFCQGQTEELMYDNEIGALTGWQSNVPERVFAVHMSPSGPCEVLSVSFYVKKEGFSEGIFFVSLFNWEGSAPATTAVYEQATAVIIQDWKEHPIEGNIIELTEILL